MTIVRFAGLFAALTLSSGLPQAQRTWTVRSSGGDFHTLAEAMAAASPGDNIRYMLAPIPSSVIDKGVNVFFGGWVVGEVVVRDIPYGQTATLSPVHAAFLDPNFSIRLRDCQGRVNIVGVRQPPNGDAIRFPSTFLIEDCDDVLLSLGSLNDTTIRRSTVRIVNMELWGDAFPRLPPHQAFPALVAEDSDITLVETFFSAGGARNTNPPMPGIRMSGGRLRMSETFVAGGVTNGVLGPAIEVTGGGVIEIGQDVDYRRPAQFITGNATVSNHRWPKVHTRLGGGRSPTNLINRVGNYPAFFQLEDEPGASGFMFISAMANEQPTPLGSLWIDLATTAPLGCGVIPATGQLEVSRILPPNVLELGQAFSVQGAVLRADGSFDLSLPVHLTVTR